MTIENKTEFVGEMYEELLIDLRKRVKDGTASPQDRKLIASIAEKHGVEVDTEVPGNPLTGDSDNFDVPFTMDDLTVGAED